MEEIWKDIPGFEGKYQVSTLGRVKSLARKGCRKDRLMKLYTDRGGYLRLSLGKGFCMKGVHRLVAMTFLPNPNNLAFVCHKDDDPSNNRVDNLFWGSHLDNERDKKSKGRHFFGKKVKCQVCGKETNPGNLKQYHNENCRKLSPLTDVTLLVKF